MKMSELIRRWPLVLLLAAVVSGCGVKSPPKFPEGGTYPRTYPAPSADAVSAPRARPAPVGTTTDTRRRDPSSDVYTPPPAATDIQSK
jgi:predicted small lipoprotein YifL